MVQHEIVCCREDCKVKAEVVLWLKDSITDCSYKIVLCFEHFWDHDQKHRKHKESTNE